MKLALCIQTPEIQSRIPVALLSGTFEEKLAKAAQLGADGVELMTANPSELETGQIQGAIEDVGLEVVAVGSGAVPFAAGLTLLHADPDAAAQAAARRYPILIEQRNTRFAGALIWLR